VCDIALRFVFVAANDCGHAGEFLGARSRFDIAWLVVEHMVHNERFNYGKQGFKDSMEITDDARNWGTGAPFVHAERPGSILQLT